MSTLSHLDYRYRHDAMFHATVDMLTKLIEDLNLTPSEVREAAMYAANRVELRRPMLPIPTLPSWMNSQEEEIPVLPSVPGTMLPVK